jgi:hypothetical protein
MQIRELSEPEYKATLVAPIRRLALGETPPVQVSLKDYVAAVIAATALPTTVSDVEIHRVYVPRGENHTHALFYFGEPNTYLVVDNGAANVLGYRILDLGELYGLKG